MRVNIGKILVAFGLLAASVNPSSGAEVFKGLGEPEVIKLDWSTRSLNSIDLNQDGLRDLVVIDNDGTKIDFLYQSSETDGVELKGASIGRNRWDPVLQDAAFRKESFTVGFAMFDLAAGDFNQDGRPDIAYTSREDPLTIRFQGAEGAWREAVEFDGFEALGWTNTLIASDLNGDGMLELVVLAGDGIRIYRVSEGGEILNPEFYAITGENPFNLIAEDVTGDSRPDLIYLNNDGKQSLALRRQLEDGSFGPELRQVMHRPARTVHAMDLSPEEGARLVAVDSRNGSLEMLALRASTEGERSVQPDVYPITVDSKSSSQYASGDLDGDGDIDLFVADTGSALIRFFEYQDGRFGSAKPFPSFASITSLSIGRFLDRGQDLLVVVSEDEKTLGISALNDSGRLEFPSNVEFGSGDPIVGAAIDFDSDGLDELALVVVDARGAHSLRLLRPADRSSLDAGWDAYFELPLEDARRAPGSIMALDVFGESGPGLLMPIPRKGPILLAPTAEGGLEEIASESNIRESLLNGVSASALSVFDVDGDGANELVVGRVGHARALKFEDGEFVMVDQFNAAKGDEKIDAVLPIFGEQGMDRLAFYLGEAGDIQFLERDVDGVFRYDRAEPVGSIALIDWIALKNTAADQGILFAGEDRFWVFSEARETFAWESVQSYETDLDEVHYSHASSGDFDADGVPELIALDGTNHVADLLGFEGGEWFSRIYWEVFEANMHYQGRQGAKLEPRQILIDDLNGDGRLDLCFLVHDRILIYPQL